MAECKHRFIGEESGVQCILCKKRLTHEEYRSYLKGDYKEPAPADEAKEESAKPAKKTKK